MSSEGAALRWRNLHRGCAIGMTRERSLAAAFLFDATAAQHLPRVPPLYLLTRAHEGRAALSAVDSATRWGRLLARDMPPIPTCSSFSASSRAVMISARDAAMAPAAAIPRSTTLPRIGSQVQSLYRPPFKINDLAAFLALSILARGNTGVTVNSGIAAECRPLFKRP
jgi:hypothetical protein